MVFFLYGKYICTVCHGECDPGDLVNGICDECRRNRDVATVGYILSKKGYFDEKENKCETNSVTTSD